MWIANRNVLKRAGEFRDGAMRLEGAHDSILDRITYTPLEDRRVCRRRDHSTDSRKMWTVSFDGIYARKTQL